jgi:type I restriction enzyme S subunit
MFTDLKPYPKYAESGVTWLGTLPAHWQVIRVKAVMHERVTKDHQGEPLLAATQSRGVIRKSDYGHRTVTAQKDLHLLKLVEVGDFVISLRSFQGGIERAYDRGIISPAYTVLYLQDTQQRDYLTFLFKSHPFVEGLTLCITGIREGQNVDYVRLSRDRLPVPPADEQAAIVKYLGHANARIGRAITAKRKLIALLEEQKQAIINLAVTRGLDPTVRRKDSGIPWLGQVPGHWRLPMLGRCLDRIEQGWSPSAAEGDLEPDQWAVLTLSSINRGVFNGNALKPIPTSREVPPNFEIHAGDLLMTRSNTRNRVGDVAIVSEPRPRTILSDLIYRLSVNSNSADKHFVALVLRSGMGRRQIEQDARGSSGTMPKISQGHIRSWRIPLPDLAEQRGIVKQAESETASIDAVVARSTREIELLREFKARLTADVVTGQVDIRAAAARLPELDLSDLVSDVGEQDDDDLDAELAESLAQVDA